MPPAVFKRNKILLWHNTPKLRGLECLVLAKRERAANTQQVETYPVRLSLNFA